MCEHENLAVKAEFRRIVDPMGDSLLFLIVGARCDGCDQAIPIVGAAATEGAPGFVSLVCEPPEGTSIILPPGAAVH